MRWVVVSVPIAMAIVSISLPATAMASQEPPPLEEDEPTPPAPPPPPRFAQPPPPLPPPPPSLPPPSPPPAQIVGPRPPRYLLRRARYWERRRARYWKRRQLRELRPAGYLQIMLGGGRYTGPFGRAVRGGASYGLAFGVEGARQIVALELRYHGLANSYRQFDTRSYAHIFAGLVRLNLANGGIRPFVTTGVGYLAMAPGNSDPEGPPRPVPVQAGGVVVPFGGGLRFERPNRFAFGVEALHYWILGGEADHRLPGTNFWTVLGTVAIKFPRR